ncbi:hypothetical protein FACS189487_07510 [Campylobacterota bacterium]|nr:hypothetical protein FACS189487_07510 [Campylobacterota bacterium]
MRLPLIALSLLAFLLSAATADNFVNPDSWGAQMPKTPLPPIEPIGSKPVEEIKSVPVVPTATTVVPEVNGDRTNDRTIDRTIMAVSKLEFWVQVGAFSDSANALSLVNKLKSNGYNSRTFPSDLNRVAVGPYITKDQADRALDAIKTIAADAFLTTPEKL